MQLQRGLHLGARGRARRARAAGMRQQTWKGRCAMADPAAAARRTTQPPRRAPGPGARALVCTRVKALLRPRLMLPAAVAAGRGRPRLPAPRPCATLSRAPPLLRASRCRTTRNRARLRYESQATNGSRVGTRRPNRKQTLPRASCVRPVQPCRAPTQALGSRGPASRATSRAWSRVRTGRGAAQEVHQRFYGQVLCLMLAARTARNACV